MVTGTLGALGVPDVLGLQPQMVRYGQAAVTGIREKITGVSPGTAPNGSPPPT